MTCEVCALPITVTILGGAYTALRFLRKADEEHN